MTAWCVYHDGSGDVHVLPLQDLRDHEARPQCWCRPRQDAYEHHLYTHHSLDTRELYESGQRELQ